MKYRKFLFSAAFLLAIGASLAFKVSPKDITTGWYQQAITLCKTGTLEQRNCSPTNPGAVCTILVAGVHKAAYEYWGNIVCISPLWQLQ
jgi:hypothetical protein